LKVQGFSKLSMLIRLKSSSLVLVVISSIPMSICNRFHERLANNGKITTFMGYRSLMPSCVRRNLRSMQKISYAASPCLPRLVSAQFALEMCLAARNRQKSIVRNPYFNVQGHPISLNSVTIESQRTISY